MAPMQHPWPWNEQADPCSCTCSRSCPPWSHTANLQDHVVLCLPVHVVSAVSESPMFSAGSQVLAISCRGQQSTSSCTPILRVLPPCTHSDPLGVACVRLGGAPRRVACPVAPHRVCACTRGAVFRLSGMHRRRHRYGATQRHGTQPNGLHCSPQAWQRAMVPHYFGCLGISITVVPWRNRGRRGFAEQRRSCSALGAPPWTRLWLGCGLLIWCLVFAPQKPCPKRVAGSSSSDRPHKRDPGVQDSCADPPSF